MKIKIFIITALVAFVSCTEYLDIKPYGKTIPKTAEEFASLLHETINKIDYGEPNIVGDMGTTADYACFSDNLETNLTQYPAGRVLPTYIGDRLLSKQFTYINLYETIRTANIIIGNLNEDKTQEVKDVLGTAYALRGVSYYQLLRQFCEPYDETGTNSELGVPLVTEFNMEEKPIRSSRKETVAQIERDFETAIKYNISEEVYRFNNDVIKGYLARLYFWTQEYDKAVEQAEELLKKYPLLEGDSYKEMLISQRARKGNTLIKSEIVADGSTSLGQSGIKGSLSARPISKRFIDLFEEQENDVRYDLFIGKKRIFAKNIFASMRSAEFALILMESYYHLGNENKAINLLNDLRQKRISPYTPYTLSTLPSINKDDYIKVDAKGQPLTPLIYAILAERRKELFLEGDRWFELKRNGRPEFWVARQGLKYYTRKFMYTFPIPIEDILLVDGLIQNDGYNKTK